MTKHDLLPLVKSTHDDQAVFYITNGPRKREQEDHYHLGVAVVGMNVELLSEWLVGHSDEAQETFDDLDPADKREVWEASGFHFGISGYDDDDADFYWKRQGAS